MKGPLANGVDPDQMPHNAASDQGLHCLHQKHEFFIKHNNKTDQTSSMLEMDQSKVL